VVEVLAVFGFVPRSLAVVGIVGGLAFAMPVSAQADVWDSAWFELSATAAEAGTVGAVVGEGVVAAAPEVAAGFGCVAALPVCAAVGGAVIGATLYLTKDTWVPWFDGGSTVSGNSATPGGCADLHLKQNTMGTVQGGFEVAGWSTVSGYGCNVFFTASGGFTAPDGTTGTWSVGTGAKTIFPSNITQPGSNNPEISWGFWTPYNGLPANVPVNSIITSLHVVGTTYDTPQGHPTIDWPASQVPPSVASLQVSCTNPDGSTYEVTSAVPSANGMVQMPTCTGAAGDRGGAAAKCVTLSAGTSLPTATVQSSDCIAAGTSAGLYPECAAVGCHYVVYVDGAACVVGRPGCVDWAATYANSPGRVGCRYGEHWVTVDKCYFMERIYENGLPVPATLANTDGNPATWTGTAPAPSTNPQTNPQPIPNGAPGGDPGTLPGGGTGALPSPGSNPQTNNDCWSGGSFSWNPVDWVMVPVKCALSWAFVPSTATLTDLSTAASTDLTTQGIGPIVTAVSTNVTKVGGGGGCDGPAVTFSAVGIVKPMHPFSACTAPMATLAAISYAMTTVVVVLGGGFVAVKAVGAGFGFNFSMRRGGGDSA